MFKSSKKSIKNNSQNEGEPVTIIKKSLRDLKNISPKNLAILEEENVTTLEDIAEFSVIGLKTLLNTTENKANLIIAEARKCLPPFKAFSGHELLDLSTKQEYLSTHCKSIDNLLGGRGFKTGTVSEIYGAFASGKTQMVLSLIMSAILPKPYGLDSSVVFIDTEGTFNIERLNQIAEYYKNLIDINELLSNIKVIRPRRSNDQMQVIKRFLENGGAAYKDYLGLSKNVKLLVVDSLTAHFRAEYLGRGTLAERQQKLSEHLRDLGDFSYENNCCSIVINQVMANPDPFSSQEAELPIGGNILSHSTYCRIWLRKRKLYRSAILMDSACLPSGEALYKIGRRGVQDVTEGDEMEFYFKEQKEIKDSHSINNSINSEVMGEYPPVPEDEDVLQ